MRADLLRLSTRSCSLTPGTETTMTALAPLPCVVTSASATPVPLTRARMMSTAWFSESWVTVPWSPDRLSASGRRGAATKVQTELGRRRAGDGHPREQRDQRDHEHEEHAAGPGLACRHCETFLR